MQAFGEYLIAGLTSGGVIAGVLLLLIRRGFDRQDKRQDKAEENIAKHQDEIRRLKEEKVLKLEEAVEAQRLWRERHGIECPAGKVKGNLEIAVTRFEERTSNVTTILSNTAAQVARYMEESNKQAVEIARDHDWIKDINTKVDNHLSNGKLHNHG